MTHKGDKPNPANPQAISFAHPISEYQRLLAVPGLPGFSIATKPNTFPA